MTCDLDVPGVPDTRLIVRESHGHWQWKMVLRANDVILAQGRVDTRLAAQVAAQLAYEFWLQGKPMKVPNSWKGTYNWL